MSFNDIEVMKKIILSILIAFTLILVGCSQLDSTTEDYVIDYPMTEWKNIGSWNEFEDNAEKECGVICNDKCVSEGYSYKQGNFSATKFDEKTGNRLGYNLCECSCYVNR